MTVEKDDDTPVSPSPVPLDDKQTCLEHTHSKNGKVMNFNSANLRIDVKLCS